MLSIALIAVSFLATSVSAAGLGKPVLFPNGLHDPMNGLDDLSAPSGSYSGVSVPSSCSSAAASLNCNASTIQAVAVTYNDCSQAWTICRCSDANLDLNTLLTRFGQVPVGLRSYVGTVLHTHTEPGAEWAYNAGGFVAINGDCPVSVFLHESAHSLDQGVSTGAEFTNAIASSSCVPDAYADTSAVEDFAQVNVVFTYKTLVGPLPVDASCMKPQLDVFENTPRLHTDLTDTTCNPAVRPSSNLVNEAKFVAAVAANRTASGTTGAHPPHYSPSAVREFKLKYGGSRDAPASKNITITPSQSKPLGTPIYAELPPPSS